MKRVLLCLLLAAGCAPEVGDGGAKALPEEPPPAAEVLYEHPSDPHALGEVDWRRPATGEKP